MVVERWLWSGGCGAMVEERWCGAVAVERSCGEVAVELCCGVCASRNAATHRSMHIYMQHDVIACIIRGVTVACSAYPL
jgi:hypothetical protein